MTDIARSLLRKLLAQVERGGRDTLPISERFTKEYFSVESLAGRDRIHANLANAEAAGAIVLGWGKGAAAQDLLRIRVLDADKLADWLGIPRARSHADKIAKVLMPLLKDAPEWLSDAFDEAMVSWRLGKSAFRTKGEEVTTAVNLFRVARAVNLHEQEDLDLRRFSVQLLNDSKAIERMLARLAPLLRRNPEWEQFDDNMELFRALGLEKFPPPIFLKGPLEIDYSNYRWDISELLPFVGVSPDKVFDISLKRPPAYLLTIENLASFQRHVREIEDDGIVVYSAGFPSPALMHILQRFDDVLSEDSPCFHWGDRDIGGLRIFSHIAKAFSSHSFKPHLMKVPLSEEQEFSLREQGMLSKYASGTGEEAALAAAWLEYGLGPMEQEAIDPESPGNKTYHESEQNER